MSTLLTKKKAAIFDLDGTLLDSMGVWLEVDRVFLARRGIALPDDYAAAISPMGFPAAAAYTKTRFSLPEDEASIMAEWHALAVDAYANHVGLKHGVREYLTSLRRRGIPFAAATASQAVFSALLCSLFSLSPLPPPLWAIFSAWMFIPACPPPATSSFTA